MAAAQPLDYATRGSRNARRCREEQVWQAAEVLSAALLVLLVVGGFLGPFVAFFLLGGFR